MPPPDEILAGLTSIANEWRAVAVAWHILLTLALLDLWSWRLSDRVLGYSLALLMLSVGAFAWMSGNPFNGLVFTALAVLLGSGASYVHLDHLHRAPTPLLLIGIVLFAFGWSYPHFVEVSSPVEYLIAAPLGLVPCPTLAVVIGLTLVFELYRSPAWSVPLAAAGLAYGVIGVFRLGVTMDVVLLAGAATLSAAVWRWGERRTVRATPAERACALPGDGLISESRGMVTHAITIPRPRVEVWPWLAQMGAGTRAGWYSYDLLDNRARPSADRIVLALQQLKVGMIFPALPGVTDCFTLLAFEPERFLILGWLSPDGRPRMTWAFVLEERAPGGTRLLVRARTDTSYAFGHLPKWLSTHLGTLVHFVMQRKQLLGVAQRIARA